ncbi:hypothetical protein [Tuwongella immobilis]|uniref:Uncharacterized protein n=1 Tax=Tuwongella immobilis TaxID=692036 RepID=A0A6C2YHW0_9BACT|nr:hypothetical protein [Tuwongella immobilis]VIP00723.1 unnamed protein product [Tuwongella immobilis]VTR96864.1 unnamed protein product [Tuwongella immobilis]
MGDWNASALSEPVVRKSDGTSRSLNGAMADSWQRMWAGVRVSLRWWLLMGAVIGMSASWGVGAILMGGMAIIDRWANGRSVVIFNRLHLVIFPIIGAITGLIGAQAMSGWDSISQQVISRILSGALAMVSLMIGLAMVQREIRRLRRRKSERMNRIRGPIPTSPNRNDGVTSHQGGKNSRIGKWK